MILALNIWIRCVYSCNTIDTGDQTYAMIWYAVEKVLKAMNVWNVVIEIGGLVELIVGFHMTSLKFKLKKYRSYRDFTFMMY